MSERSYHGRDDELINVDLNDELKHFIIFELNDVVSKSLEGELTYRVVTNVLKRINNFKSPRPVGYTAEFFKLFWPLINLLYDVLNYWCKVGKLSDSQ